MEIEHHNITYTQNDTVLHVLDPMFGAQCLLNDQKENTHRITQQTEAVSHVHFMMWLS